MSRNTKNVADNSNNYVKGRQSDRLKFFCLAAIFFLIIGSYTIIRDLKNAVFIGLIGKDYIPIARLVFLFMLVPAILLYSKIVDKIKKYYLLSVYSIFYAVLCLIFAIFIGHSSIGIANTDQSPYRLFGWLFYFFVEGFSPFVLSIFWAFSNSISDPGGAKRNYGLMVSGSALGGMFTAGIAWVLFSYARFPIVGIISDISKMRIILVMSSVLLFTVPIIIKILMRVVPERYLRGYEAAYKIEKQRGKSGKSKTGIFVGLNMLIKHPYVLGIFSMIFLYETLNSVLSYLRLGLAQKVGGSIAGTSSFLFKWVFITQAVGFVISFVGTSSLLRRLGIRTCLFLIPIIMGGVVLCFVLTDTPFIIMIAFTLMKSVNYAFSKPVVEFLYIPTLKEIKFKSKSWIDAFGSKLAKGSGSLFNLTAGYINPSLVLPVYSLFFAIIVGVWVVSSFLLGRRFDKAIKANEVIGLSQEGVK